MNALKRIGWNALNVAGLVALLTVAAVEEYEARHRPEPKETP